ncbi:hypothetical protein LCGC14_1204410 [marine sediment metagenome]|uniref:Uncharacterized protein n=1 Tax=marine sediment metagenome TaxID=412755 RepID=A0A0F9LKB5_9ZZZZ
MYKKFIEKQKERQEIMVLKDEVIRALTILSLHDRDIKSIFIYCNPNFINGADRDMKVKILNILEKLQTEGLITSQKMMINMQCQGHGSTEYILYTLKGVDKING